MMSDSTVRPFLPEEFRWEGVDLLQYKQGGTHFKDITRQVLFGAEHGLSAELRYFEIAPGGYSTFERHEHIHAVLIFRGHGRALIGSEVRQVQAFDLVHVAPMTWHQFRADADSPLGFLCLVACDRDRPQRPNAEEADALRQDPTIAAFMQL